MRRPCALAAMVLAALACAGPAAASPSQESILQDDPEIVFSSAARLDRTLGELRAIGVDRIRVSVFWYALAPSPDSRERPTFRAGAANPRSYDADKWERYDRIVKAAGRHGLGVLFSITGAAPLWATGRSPRPDLQRAYDPSAADFRDFVTAVGLRYSGTYTAERAPAPPPDGPQLPPPLGEEPPEPPPAEVIPRVDHWSIWNEPNQAAWLAPQWRDNLPVAARKYRALLDAGWAGLVSTGHGGDVFLLAETAPRGSARRGVASDIRPLEFVRELYCLNRRLKPYLGEPARRRGCPPTVNERAAFPGAHPGLFQADGWAHHPYALELVPSRRDPVKDHVVLSGLGRLTQTLDRVLGSYGEKRRLPVWLTEYGYQTDPPDPTIGIPWKRQASYLNEADYIAYGNKRVASVAQFLLVDDRPRPGLGPSDPGYWGTFQSGLVAVGGKRKPAYSAYRRPIHVSPAKPRKGRKLRVFGQLRDGPRGAPLRVRLEFRRKKQYTTVASATTRNPRRYVVLTARAAASGYYRLVWTHPTTGAPLPTRPVKVTLAKRRR